MYETWVKSLIDLLDELSPVTLVRNRLEVPLGSVTGDMSVVIHSQLDLTDEDSPWCDLIVEQAKEKVEVGYMIHIPNLNKRTDDEIQANVKTVSGEGETVLLLQPVGTQGQETYVIKGTFTTSLAPQSGPFHASTNDLVNRLVRLMECGGFERLQALETVDEAADDLVTWSST